MKILDATASNRSIWYQKDNPFTTFLDKRVGKIYGGSSECLSQNNRIIKIFPDIQALWQHLPIKDNVFDMVIFDPPHLFKDKGAKLSLMSKRYGVFYKDSWKQELSTGLHELFRILKNEGIFIFKWNECDILVQDTLKLFPYRPLFGTRTGQNNNTHWILFIKYREEKQLSDF